MKAVLRELAEWDDVDSEVYNGVARIAYDTEIPEPSVYKALRVLEENGWLQRKSRGLGRTKLKVLDWDKIEAAREEYVPGEVRKKKEPDDSASAASRSARRSDLQTQIDGERLYVKVVEGVRVEGDLTL